MAQQTAINGDRFDFTTLSLEASTAPRFGAQNYQFAKGVIASINYDATQDGANVQGNQVGVVGRTPGYGTSTGSMEVLVSESDDFHALITNNGQIPIMSVYFDLRVSYSVNGTDVRTDTLRGIRITKIGSANQKGSDASTKTYELNIAQIFLNGIAAYGDPAA